MKQFWIDTTKISDGELADLIHELSDELDVRCRNIKTGNWLTNQLDSATLTVRSWSSNKQRAFKMDWSDA